MSVPVITRYLEMNDEDESSPFIIQQHSFRCDIELTTTLVLLDI